MKDFTGKIPRESGYYWYIDKEYPQPVIGFVSGGKFYGHRNRESTQYVGKYLFIGPQVPQLHCTEVNIVE